MDDAEQARAYAEADFAEPHQAFVTYFQERFPRHRPQRVVDLGCGPCDVTVRFARAYPDCQILALDGSEPMLAQAHALLAGAQMLERVTLVQRSLPDLSSVGHDRDTLISNSLLHHLHDPLVLWRTVHALAVSGAVVQVMDLMRPPSRSAVLRLVEAYASDAPDVLRRDFANSLSAAFTPTEIVAQLAEAGLALRVEVVSDRHVLVSGQL